MKLTRRQFLKIFSSSCVSAGLTTFYNKNIINALAAVKNKPAVIWLQGAGCNGCSISLLNTVHPKIQEVLFDILNVKYHPTIMAASGKTAFNVIYEVAEKFKGEYILILEGAIPTAENGRYCMVGEYLGHHVTLTEVLDKLIPNAKHLIAVGTCASFGGVSAGNPNSTKCKGLADYCKKEVINISGCPIHPDWVIGSLVHLLHFGVPELDKHRRPLLFYGKNLHENCPNHSYYTSGKYAQKLGDEGCLVGLGCKGPTTFADCPKRQWNSAVNWCIGSGTGCIACTEKDFPDKVSPLYTKLPDELMPKKTV